MVTKLYVQYCGPAPVRSGVWEVLSAEETVCVCRNLHHPESEKRLLKQYLSVINNSRLYKLQRLGYTHMEILDLLIMNMVKEEV